MTGENARAFGSRCMDMARAQLFRSGVVVPLIVAGDGPGGDRMLVLHPQDMDVPRRKAAISRGIRGMVRRGYCSVMIMADSVVARSRDLREAEMMRSLARHGIGAREIHDKFGFGRITESVRLTFESREERFAMEMDYVRDGVGRVVMVHPTVFRTGFEAQGRFSFFGEHDG